MIAGFGMCYMIRHRGQSLCINLIFYKNCFLLYYTQYGLSSNLFSHDFCDLTGKIYAVYFLIQKAQC